MSFRGDAPVRGCLYEQPQGAHFLWGLRPKLLGAKEDYVGPAAQSVIARAGSPSLGGAWPRCNPTSLPGGDSR